MGDTVKEDDNPTRTPFEERACAKPPTLLKEFIVYLGQNKKWWLIPFLLALALFGAILALSLSGGIASIYTLF